MRTRFLTPNFFATAQTLDFLRLPLSPISSATHFTADFDGEFFRSAVDSSSSGVSLELENLPVDDALSKFYSDVLPHTIDVENGGSPVTLGFDSAVVQVPEKGADSCYIENTAQSCLTSQSESLDNQFSEERKDDTEGDKIQNGPVMIQFEIPELSEYVENACMSEKANILFQSEVQAHDDNLEMLNLVPVDQFGFDSKDSIHSVETICLEYDMAQKLQMPEDHVDLLPKNYHLFDTAFPLLEVDETGAADIAWLCVEDARHSLLANIEEDHSVCHEDLERSCQNLLVSVKIDILEDVFDCHTSKLPLEFCFTSLNLTVDIDFLKLIETPYSQSKIGVDDSVSIPFVEAFQFEEFEMLDADPFDIFEALAISQIAKEPETCDQLLHSNPHFKGFDELVVSSELAIVDGTFTSLPVPVIVDDEKIWSVEIIVDTVLTELEQLPFSTSDEIYLDWHLLGNDKCNGHVNAAIEKVFNDTEDYAVSSNLEPCDCCILVLDFLLSEDSLEEPSTGEDKLDLPSGGICSGSQRVNHTATKRTLDDDCQIIESGVKIPKTNVYRVASGKLSDDDDCQIIENHQLLADFDRGEVASPFESMPQVGDLDFFLNPRKTSAGMKMDHRSRPPVAKSMLSGGLDKKAVAAAAPTTSMHTQQLNIQLHRVMLPANMLIVTDSLRRSYLAIFRENMQLSKTEFVDTDFDDINLLRLPEHCLMDHFSRSSKHKSCMGYRDVNDVIFVTLCAIKRMAFCLCYYGIYNLHIFLCKLFQSLAFLKPRLLSLHSLIEDANGSIDKQITKSHPSLATIREILQQDSIRRGKVLILAQQDLWGSLKRLLTSMNISCIELDESPCGYQSDLSYDLSAGGLRNHAQTTCALVKHEHISRSILMHFDLIVECGGLSGVSRVSTLFAEHTGSQTLHFLKIELDEVARALCEGVIFASGDTDTIKFDELLNFGPLTKSSNISSAEASAGGYCDRLPEPVRQTAQESEAVQACDASFPDLVIIVNTENFDKEMIISRRSTYQKILSMEKRGAQVVERDLMLPIDIILDAATCIVWYDCKNIGKKATAEDEGSSSVPLCIENIATNVLTSLSFTFTVCVLVFEGDSNFLGFVMESADELYAAAASLGTDLQIFCSYSFELTDEIILNYIGQARKFTKGLLPRLPETETHAESFLTRFPSINPLSAHAIISCGCMLLEFLEWSGDCRIHALRKHNLPEESVNLLSVLFKYGEREESKSGLTDCSSSVSSPPDSDKFARKVNSVDRKRKLIPNSSDAMYDFKCSRESDKCMDGGLNYYGSPSDLKASKSPRMSLQEKLPDFWFDDKLFGEEGKPATAADMNPSNTWPESTVPETVKVPKSRDGFAKSTLFVNDGFGERKLGRDIENKREEFAMDILQDLPENFVGEVVDIYDKTPFGVAFQAAERAVKPSPLDCETVEDHAPRSSKAVRKLSFDSSSYLNFPKVDDMNISCGLQDNRQLAADNDYSGVNYNWGSNCFKPQQELIGTGLFEKSIKNFRGPLSREEFVPSYGETPLSKAVHSAQSQQGSPWTIEFLNRIKEKRRLRQQNQPWDTSVPQSANRGNISKATKRRSPSILEYYKYQGGSHNSTPRKSTPQRLQKQHGQLSNEKSSGLRPTWTPIDKRARRSLSFATSGAGGQTKLVWGDNILCSKGSRFSNI